MHHRTSLLIIILIPIYVLGVFVADVLAPTHVAEEVPREPLTLTFVGDMMFDRYIREKASVFGYDGILVETVGLFENSTYVIGNLEGPITTFAPVANWRESGPDHFTFTFATSVASTLYTAGFTGVSLANNHSLNFGTLGLEQAKKWLTQNNLQYVGAPDELYTPLRFASNTPSIVVYAYDSWYAHDAQKLVELIQAEQEEVFVVVYAHWGEEYEEVPNKTQKEFAHDFIDAGADFVVGSHPHVIQTKELYKNKWIYYSLGNFVFDQYFNEQATCGAVVTLSIGEHLEYRVEEKFITLEPTGSTKVSSCREFVVEEK